MLLRTALAVAAPSMGQDWAFKESPPNSKPYKRQAAGAQPSCLPWVQGPCRERQWSCSPRRNLLLSSSAKGFCLEKVYKLKRDCFLPIGANQACQSSADGENCTKASLRVTVCQKGSATTHAATGKSASAQVRRLCTEALPGRARSQSWVPAGRHGS